MIYVLVEHSRHRETIITDHHESLSNTICGMTDRDIRRFSSASRKTTSDDERGATPDKRRTSGSAAPPSGRRMSSWSNSMAQLDTSRSRLQTPNTASTGKTVLRPPFLLPIEQLPPDSTPEPEDVSFMSQDLSLLDINFSALSTFKRMQSPDLSRMLSRESPVIGRSKSSLERGKYCYFACV